MLCLVTCRMEERSSRGFLALFENIMQKLKLCFKILRKESCIPPTAFTPMHPQPSPRSLNSVQLFTPFVPTDAHKFSYFIDVIKHWNALPDEIVSAQTPLIFKNRFLLQSHYNCSQPLSPHSVATILTNYHLGSPAHQNTSKRECRQSCVA